MKPDEVHTSAPFWNGPRAFRDPEEKNVSVDLIYFSPRGSLMTIARVFDRKYQLFVSSLSFPSHTGLLLNYLYMENVIVFLLVFRWYKLHLRKLNHILIYRYLIFATASNVQSTFESLMESCRSPYHTGRPSGSSSIEVGVR